MKDYRERRLKQIGIDRIIRLKWLEKTALLYLSGSDTQTIRRLLVREIASSFKSINVNVRGSLDKTLTNLMRVWVSVPSDLEAFRAKGLKLLTETEAASHIVVHWGMIMAVYPFWAHVAAQVGRLLNLQNIFQLKSIQQRLLEQYGQRQTVSRSAQRVIRSFVDWGVLRDTENNGIYARSDAITVDRIDLINWLIEAYLYTLPSSKSTLQNILSAMSLFPFKFSYIPVEKIVQYSDNLELFRQGLDQTIITLKVN